MEQLRQMHPVVTVFLFIMLIALWIDHRRLMKQNKEWYNLYIISKVNVESFEGMAILKAVQDGESSKVIISQLKQVNEDNSMALARMYGNWYPDLLRILKSN
jgi:hypothetical protein